MNRGRKRKKKTYKKLCDKINQVILNPSLRNDSIRRIPKYGPELPFQNGTNSPETGRLLGDLTLIKNHKIKKKNHQNNPL